MFGVAAIEPPGGVNTCHPGEELLPEPYKIALLVGMVAFYWLFVVGQIDRTCYNILRSRVEVKQENPLKSFNPDFPTTT